MVQQIKLLFHFICPLLFISGCAGTYTATQDDVDMGFADEIGQSVKLNARTKARKRYLKSPDYAYEKQIQDLEKALDAGEITDAQYRLMANQAKMYKDQLNIQGARINNAATRYEYPSDAINAARMNVDTNYLNSVKPYYP